MNKREAALILQLRYATSRLRVRKIGLMNLQRETTHKRTDTKESPNTHDVESSRSRRKSIPSDESQRGERVLGEELMSTREGRCRKLCIVRWFEGFDASAKAFQRYLVNMPTWADLFSEITNKSWCGKIMIHCAMLSYLLPMRVFWNSRQCLRRISIYLENSLCNTKSLP